jgi:hypothetical protein
MNVSSGLTKGDPCVLQVSAMKYQLPSDPSVYVDVVDDEDVSLMLDEWREASAAAAPGLNPSRLHIFVQWCAPAWLSPLHLWTAESALHDFIRMCTDRSHGMIQTQCTAAAGETQWRHPPLVLPTSSKACTPRAIIRPSHTSRAPGTTQVCCCCKGGKGCHPT